MACRVAVQHMDLETLTGLRVDERAGDTPAEHWLVDVGRHQFVWLWDQVARIQVLPVDQCGEPASFDLSGWDDRGLMAGIAHAVAPVLLWWHHLEFGLDRAVAEDSLDLQVDVTDSHGVLLPRQRTRRFGH